METALKNQNFKVESKWEKMHGFISADSGIVNIKKNGAC